MEFLRVDLFYAKVLPLIYWVFCLSVSQALQENTYPFLAMIMLKDRRMTVVGRLEGLIQPDDLINQLTFIMDANQTYLVSERLERYRGVPLGLRETGCRFRWLTWGSTHHDFSPVGNFKSLVHLVLKYLCTLK